MKSARGARSTRGRGPETTRNDPADLEVESGYIAKDSPLRDDGRSSRSIREGDRVTNHIPTGLPALKSLISGFSGDGACAVCFAGRSN
jgi:hypothetical protein